MYKQNNSKRKGSRYQIYENDYWKY